MIEDDQGNISTTSLSTTNGITASGRLTANANMTLNGEMVSTDGNGLISYHPASWTGVSSSEFGVGTVACATKIRSSGDNLYHYNKADGSSYKIIDTNNFNSTLTSKVSTLLSTTSVSGGKTVSFDDQYSCRMLLVYAYFNSAWHCEAVRRTMMGTDSYQTHEHTTA